METKRQRQAAELIKRNFGIVLQNEGSYIYGDALVTVTNVKVSPDFGIAKIYLSVYNTLDKQSAIMMLQENYVRLRHALGERIKKHIRRIPNLEFFQDDTLDEMYKLNQLFDRLDEERKNGSKEEE